GGDMGGVAAMMGGGMGASGGYSKRMNGDISFSNEWKNKLKVQSSYRFGIHDNLTLRNSTAQEYYQDGIIYAVNDSRSSNESQNHVLSSRWEFRPSERDRLFFNITGSYNRSDGYSDATVLQSGALRVDQGTGRVSRSATPSYNMDASYMRTFGTKGMN